MQILLQAIALGAALAPMHVAAQASSSRTSKAGAPLQTSYPNPADAIPSDATSGCRTWLSNSLNTNAQLEACTAPLITVTNSYVQATSQRGATAASDANALTTALDSLCRAGCQTNVIKGIVSDFATNCLEDMVAQNDKVISAYDSLYLIVPFQQALCTKDKSNNYCVTSLAASGKVNDSAVGRRRRSEMEQPVQEKRDTAGRLASAQDAVQVAKRMMDELLERASQGAAEDEELMRRTAADQQEQENLLAARQSTAAAASAASNDTNLPFLFVKPSSPKEVLCGECTQQVLARYIQFETASPYAIGLKNSDVLASQSELYKAGKATCGDGWSTYINQLANTTAFAEVSAAQSVRAVGGARYGAAAVALAVGAAAYVL